MKWKRYVGRILLAFVILFGVMQTASAADIPQKPQPGVYVVDTAGILSPQAEAEMNRLAREVDEKTTLKSWTIMETLIGITGLVLGLIISIFA